MIPGQELKILFRHDKAYLTPDSPLNLQENLGLPPIAETFKAPAYWTVEILNYRQAEQKLFCKILSYHVGDSDFPPSQKMYTDLLKQIQTVTFRSIDTAGLLRTLNSTTPISLKPPREEPVYRQEIRDEPVSNVTFKPLNQTFTETFSVPLKNVQFKLGVVVFDKKITGYHKTIEINIPNSEIIEEFDAVKNYFANVLGTKKINVTATVEIEGDQIKSITATSPEIDKIDKGLIDDVKLEFVRATKRKTSADIEKVLLTSEEYLQTFNEENFPVSLFYSDEKELFEDLLKITDSKHYKHLRFLSSRHSHQIMKLRFIHKPFSFLFLLEGDTFYHLVWETLDTEEATYIWYIEKDLQILKNTLKRIESVISQIKIEGKMAYISSTEDLFKRIYHDYSDSNNGFFKWKGELESVLT